HPSEELLLAYASGAADEATSLIVAAHLAFCALCRRQGREMESVGGSLLQELAPVPMSGGALDAALLRLDGIKPFERPARAASGDGTPSVLRRYIGGDLKDARWRRIGSRLAYVPLLRHGNVTARLLRGVPGSETGPHRHAGLEYTLVLKGGFRDETGSYAPGDLQVMEGEMRHNPVADAGGDCINLAVTTGPLKFESLLQKIVAPLFGF
ncbi:MAG TPA: ChrR family anti-sigma-E factor, partial [Rhizomicrobium sp.]|nr:ChrR family anti-sigma-E factor [Rhizomicrobium sp.]